MKTLSKGNQQKVNQELFVEPIGELRAAGTTVLFSAHQMALVERLADRVFLLGPGREVLHGTVAELRRRWQTGDRLVLDVPRDADITFLAGHPAVDRIEDGTGADRPREVKLLLKPGVPLGDLLRVVGERLDVAAVRTGTSRCTRSTFAPYRQAAEVDR